MEKEINTNFRHHIYTRFNVPTQDWVKTKKGKKVLNDEWMDERMNLFLKYCLPGFQNQSVKNFDWYVFFDENTKARYWEKIQEIEHKNDFFHPIKVNDNDQVKEWVVEHVKELPAEIEYIISTDVDNDDAIHQDFIQSIQKKYEPQHDLVIDLVKGYRLLELPKNRIMLQRYDSSFNAFVSVVESRNQFKSIFKEWHKNYRYFPNTIMYDEKPMYMQVVHNSNQLNSFVDHWAQFSGNFKEFGLDEKNLKFDLYKTFIHNVRLAVKKTKQKIKSNINKASVDSNEAAL